MIYAVRFTQGRVRDKNPPIAEEPRGKFKRPLPPADTLHREFLEMSPDIPQVFVNPANIVN